MGIFSFPPIIDAFLALTMAFYMRGIADILDKGRIRLEALIFSN